LDVDTVASPEVVFYPHSGKIRVMSGKYQKNFKDDTEVNYLYGE
ncbi:MAG TPA: cupin, partial [Pelotomaculum sp.]|nr:cupin [Pelotomaculum sp.]